MKRFHFLVLALAICGGCSQAPVIPPTTAARPLSPQRETSLAELRKKLATVTISDGISKPEAELIARYYFYQNVGCGYFIGIRNGGDFWIVDGTFGYTAKPIQGFHIEKSGGKITSPVGPSDRSLSEMLH